ncbi:glycosyltransferase family 4 protein [Winogradskyella aquimaris]|uniref:Glycosyltransferase family 4 protein n=1 Tax=Winogradskyella aquimaris TaxID=864074 RepID=A0ABU5EKY8_9FLAO|nr:glycosyltransferase family 4 protein [Winogradskyella aquimaris]MDY2587080.1 glycosyltransferase family 4 protein [Winogradskyella aquimaris]
MTKRILWVTASFNHYKARFLNHFGAENSIVLTLLTGTGRSNMGDQEIDEDWSFKHIKVEVPKKDFGRSKQVKEKLQTIFADFDWVLIPAEKKNISLLLFTLSLKNKHPSVRLFSYNHLQFKSKNRLLSISDKTLTRFFYNRLDRVIFYTEESCKRAVNMKMINKNKAYWANNTIDTTEVEKYYQFELPPKHEQRILFIGRLITSKRIDDLIVYYEALQRHLPNLYLDIIGDGPEGATVNKAIKHNKNIIWHGTIVDEARIAPIMRRASLVLVPGLSGLSINHAFAYGRPYITLAAEKHGPEISYVVHGENGYVLDRNFGENIKILKNLLEDYEQLAAFCRNAKATGDTLTVDQWVVQMKSSLIDAE